MRLLVLTLPFCLFGLSIPAFSQDCAPTDESQMCLNKRAGADYEAEDTRLNKAYHQIIQRLSDDPESRKLLQAAQRAWIAFRDAECAFSTNDSKDGSINPMLVAGCRTDLTKVRIGQLDAYLDCQEGDMSCPVPPAQ